MERISSQSSQLSKYINKDLDPIKTDKEFLSFMLNGVANSTEGSMGSIEHEPGNKSCFELEGYEERGFIIANNETLLFFTNGQTTKVGMLKECEFEEILSVDYDCLPIDHVQGEFRVRNGCERVFYFYDCVNSDRRINVDRLERYWTDEYREWDRNGGEEPTQIYDCNLFRLNPIVDNICVEGVADSGGQLEIGMYYPVIEVLDSEQNVIYISEPGLGVLITEGQQELIGSFNIDNTDPLLGGVPKVDKSIKVKVEGLNTNFAFVRLNFIRAITGDGITRDAIRLGQLYPVNQETINITYDGFTSGDTFVDPSELLVPNVVYDTSCAMTQIQNRLVRMNLKDASYPFGEWQKAASRIKTTWRNKTIPYIKGQVETMPADEVVPIAIEFIIKDGTVSPPYHIPGRCLYDSNDYTIEQGTGCLMMNFKGLIKEDDVIKYSLTYKKYGIEKTVELEFTYQEQDNIRFTPVDEDVEVDCGDITDVILTVEDNAALSYLDVSFFISEPPDPNPIVPTEIDGYVSPFWSIEIEHLISKDDYQRIAGDLYGKLDLDSILALRELPLPKRWEIYNTAYKTGNNKGEMGYHEVEQTTYDIPINYCEDDFWGVDFCGNPLEGAKVRHHRLPDRKLIPVSSSFDSSLVNQIGLEFENIVYPHPDIVDHRILVGKRTEDTVLDNGISVPLRTKEIDDLEVTGFSYLPTEEDNRSVSFISPKVLIDNSYLQGGNHLKLNYYQTYGTDFRSFKGNHPGEFVIDLGSGKPTTDYRALIRPWNIAGIIGNGIEESSRTNFDVLKNLNIPPGSEYADEKTYVNFSTANNIKFLDLNWELDINGEYGDGEDGNRQRMKVGHTSLKRATNNVYTNLGAILYRPLDPCDKDGVYYKGGNWISKFEFTNHLFTGINGGFLKILLYALAVALAAATGGISLGLTSALLTIGGIAFAAALGFGSIMQALSDGNYDPFIKEDFGTDNKGGGGNGQSHYFFEFLNDTYIESKYRYDLLANSIDECGRRFDFDNLNNLSSLITYVERVIAYYNEEEEDLVLKPIPCPEAYLYNKDFHRTNCDKLRTGLDYSFDFCSKCINEFPNRIVYSQPAFENETQDAYSVTLANNFYDIPAHKGPITGCMYKRNKLFIHTTHTTFLKQPNPQILQTNQGSVYVGTGEFLALPEVELNETSTGYAGMQSRWGSYNTPYGYVWVDNIRGSVFLFDSKLQEISLQGLEQWSQENLPQGEAYVGYDPKFKRIIITNKDKFTYSYGIKEKSWLSWHSYLPNYIFNDSTHFYTLKDGVYQHLHQGSYLNFYGKKYDFVVEWGIPTPATQILNAIHYVDYPKMYDEENKTWIELPHATFDRMWIYNSNQSTGIQQLDYINQIENPYGNVEWGNPTVIRTNKNYKIGRIYDYSTGSPVYTKNVTGDYIDILPLNIDKDKSQYDLSYLNDKYVMIRLFSNNDFDIKQSLHFVNGQTLISIR